MATRMSTRRFDSTAVVEVAGDLDLRAAPEFAAAVAVARVGHDHIVADLSRVDFIDSTALRELLGQAETSAKADRTFSLVAPRGHARRIFEVTRTWGRFRWLDGAPDGAVFEPLPRRVARHRAALPVVEDLCAAGRLDDAARVISDAVGDACVINRVVRGTVVEPIALVHRERGAEALMLRTLREPVPIARSAIFRDAVGSARPVFADPSGVDRLQPSAQAYALQQGIAGIACLPLVGAGQVRGLLGCARDGGHGDYDAEDRVFLTRAAAALSASATFAEAASG